MSKTVRVKAFAKVNLRLHVLGKLPDGYHELRTIFQAISLHDSIELGVAKADEIALEVVGSDVPANSQNLVWRAIEAVKSELGLRQGIEARLTKRIPMAAGLGGGSSDAAATIRGVLRMVKREIPVGRLIEIASLLGADVPFFLFGGRALGMNRGNEIYPLEDLPVRTVLVVAPRGISVNTREAYSWLDERLTTAHAPFKMWSFCALCWSRQDDGLSNDFESAVFRRHGRLSEIKRQLLQGGAAEAALAGSGSAVFGIFRNPAQARRAARAFPEDRVFVTRTLSRATYQRAVLAR